MISQSYISKHGDFFPFNVLPSKEYKWLLDEILFNLSFRNTYLICPLWMPLDVFTALCLRLVNKLIYVEKVIKHNFFFTKDELLWAKSKIDDLFFWGGGWGVGAGVKFRHQIFVI